MTTHSISYFKNHALELLDTMAVRGEEMVITRRGKPLAHVEPVRVQEAVVLGRLKGTMKMRGDIVAPLGAEDWEACR